MSRSAYIFLDESGNFDFSANGTRYFVLTAVRMSRPFPVFSALMDYKYDCLESGADIEYFHCYDDSKHVRSAVFDLIGAHLDGMDIYCLVVEKSGVSLAMQGDATFYPTMMGRLLSVVLRNELEVDSADEIIVITDTIPVNRKRRAVEKATRTTLSQMLPGVRYRVLHHQSRSHYGLQVADYCCWAVFRKWQRGERAWYDRISPAVRNELLVGHVGEGR